MKYNEVRAMKSGALNLERREVETNEVELKHNEVRAMKSGALNWNDVKLKNMK